MLLRWFLILVLSLTVAGAAPGNAALSLPSTADLIEKSLLAPALPAPAKPDARLATGVDGDSTPIIAPDRRPGLAAGPVLSRLPAIAPARYLHPQPQAPPASSAV